MQRRAWLQSWVLGTVQSLTGLGWSRLWVSEAYALQTGPGTLYLKVSDYPALQEIGGSIKVDLGELISPLIVTRAATEVFHALDSKCTHAGCSVGSYSAVNGFIQCPCHGSRYDIQGHVVRGPADQNLTSYPVTFRSTGELSISHPGLSLNVMSAQIVRRSAGGMRLRLTFQATESRRYQLHHRSSPEAVPQVVAFALQEYTDVTQMEMTATSDGLRHLYVDTFAKRGFYQVIEVE